MVFRRRLFGVAILFLMMGGMLPDVDGGNGLWAAATADRPPPDITLRRSDVVFMYDNPAKYEPYGCTVMGWAGHGDAKRVAEAHAKGVRLFATSIGFRTEGRGVIDFTEKFLDAACYDLDAKPITVPWLWDHKYKGHPYYWWCTNSPEFRRYLEHRLQQAMSAGPDGLHIDDYTGTAGCVTWLGGCFCRHCMAGFRQYLAQQTTPETQQTLAKLGITDLTHFDYGEFLRSRGVQRDEYLKRRWAMPLAREFLDFQMKANTQFVVEFRRQAEKLRGRPMAFCVNSGLSSPEALAIAPHLTYFCCEVDHQAAKGQLPGHPIYVYKLADGLGRPVASTASGYDWSFVHEHKKEGLVRLWIALSYAMGHNFMAPHRQWCYTQEKGTHWYDGPDEAYAWVYQFVRRQARLLDGYEAVAPVAVLYDNAARRQGRANIEPICIRLAELNIPFTVVVQGDDWLEGYQVRPEKLAGFRAVIVPKDHPALAEKTSEQKTSPGSVVDQKGSAVGAGGGWAAGGLGDWGLVGGGLGAVGLTGGGVGAGGLTAAGSPAGQKEPPPWLAGLQKDGRLVVWPDQAALEKLLPQPIQVQGSDQVFVVPRIRPDDPKSPVVLHLVSRAYRMPEDRMEVQKGFTVRLRLDILDQRRPKRAVLHAPKADPQNLPVSSENDSLSVEVPQLDFWALVELSE